MTSSNAIHKYPGYGLNLRHCAPDIFSVDGSYRSIESRSKPIPVREVFMMRLINELSDKPGWERKVFDKSIADKWRKELGEINEAQWYSEVLGDKETPMTRRPRGILSPEIFDYCLLELQRKAEYAKATGLIPTLDCVGNGLVKSDTAVDGSLKRELRTAFTMLIADQDPVDWHPWTFEMVQDLVHPSLYPFVHGRSTFIPEEVVGVVDAVQKWSGKSGIRTDSSHPDKRSAIQRQYNRGPPPELWSEKYQWLPSNLAFQDDGTVRFTSYVNNLHPVKYSGVYRTVEKLIDKAIPAWDQCIGSLGGVRPARRLADEGYCDDGDESLWVPMTDAEIEERLQADVPGYSISDREENYIYEEIGHELNYSESGVSREELEAFRRGEVITAAARASIEAIHARIVRRYKYHEVRDIVIPMPDPDAFDFDYEPERSLRDLFKDSGLQVIVKMASIELTPEKPSYEGGSWHVEGMFNEHICATALYYLDSENVTTSHLEFRMNTSNSAHSESIEAGQDAYNYLERLYGTELSSGGDSSYCLQHYGRVATPEGRLLAFPNTFQHRVSSFRLQDPLQPGHRRFIALWLVDPKIRTINTANVPPQRADWWVEAALQELKGSDLGTTLGPEVARVLRTQTSPELSDTGSQAVTPGARLPEEIIQLVSEAGVLPEGLWTDEEAKERRLELMRERTRRDHKAEEAAYADTYSFCEH